MSSYVPAVHGTESPVVLSLMSANAHRESRAMVRDAFGGDANARSPVATDGKRAAVANDACAHALALLSLPDAVAHWRAGDDAVHRAARMLACRGLRALVVRVQGEDATSRYVPVDPFGRDANEAVSAAWMAMVHPTRAARRASPATGEELVRYLRAAVRRMIRPMERVASRFSAQNDPDAIAARAASVLATVAGIDEARSIGAAIERLPRAERDAVADAASGNLRPSPAGQKALERARQKIAVRMSD